ncbi:thioesterase II family protein [Metabacillus halosaccharovorans]|uniref:thioesterase II family protein n=1 Tax=Metabacillus halosaccharovorans TaxID=930124 RepID=UPI00203E8F43|nr:alpha/beta fold hydrolase [Metabacillus halosaccharovorans]MCM3439299.1 thioesterase domain-containing protein [Metabacillus halosaccharovorans]
MKTILFCIPYAGDSATIYMQWKQLLGNHIELYPLEPAGRGARYDEPFDTNFTSMTNDLAAQIKQNAKNKQYAVFGHSMGAVLAYELYYLLSEEGFPQPRHLFLSGRPAPVQNNRKKSFLSRLVSEKVGELFQQSGGIPAEIAKHPELARKFKQVLKSDLRIMNTYQYIPKQERVGCPVTIFSGKQDEISEEEILAWKDHSNNDCKIVWVKGDHFFLHSRKEELVSVINQSIPEISSS